jgi:hypothetical protein
MEQTKPQEVVDIDDALQRRINRTMHIVSDLNIHSISPLNSLYLHQQQQKNTPKKPLFWLPWFTTHFLSMSCFVLRKWLQVEEKYPEGLHAAQERMDQDLNMTGSDGGIRVRPLLHSGFFPFLFFFFLFFSFLLDFNIFLNSSLGLNLLLHF